MSNLEIQGTLCFLVVIVNSVETTFNLVVTVNSVRRLKKQSFQLTNQVFRKIIVKLFDEQVFKYKAKKV